MRHGPVCKRWQGARQDFRGRQNSTPNQGAERPGAVQVLFPNGKIVPGAAHLPSFSHLCPKISQSCPDICPDCESCPDEILSKPATFFSLGHGLTAGTIHKLVENCKGLQSCFRSAIRSPEVIKGDPFYLHCLLWLFILLFRLTWPMYAVSVSDWFVVSLFQRHTTELGDGYDWNKINLRSVTEETSIDEFLNTAQLAGTEFVVSGPVHLMERWWRATSMGAN